MQINQPSFGFELSDSSAEAAQVAAEIREHNSHVERHESNKREIESVAEWLPSAFTRAAELGRRKVELIASEIRVRQRIESLYESVAAVDRPAADQAAVEALQTITARIRSGVVELGYLNGPTHVTRQPFTVDYFTASHPLVRAAKGEADSFIGKRLALMTQRQDNLESLEDAEAKLAAEKRKALAAV